MYFYFYFLVYVFSSPGICHPDHNTSAGISEERSGMLINCYMGLQLISKYFLAIDYKKKKFSLHSISLLV